MAPEQARGETVDHRCDLFSLGCVLYRLCTGEMPFKGKDAMSTLLALAMEHPKASRELNPDVPPALNHLIQRLLAKNAPDRPASAQAVVTALQDIERGPAQPTTAPTPMTPRTTRPSRSRRWVAVAAGLLLLLVPAMYFFAPTVLRIATNKGLLVIETEDAGVEVIVIGQAARIVDSHSKREIEVSAGEQEIVVKEMPDGLRFVTKKLTLTRGGKEVVRAGLELAQAVKSVPPPKNQTKIEGGEPLSALALVKRPARIDGVRSWSLETRRQRGAYLFSAVSQDNRVAAAGTDGTIRVWDSAKRQMIRALVPNTGQINGLSWSPDGKRLAVAGQGVVTQWEVATGQLMRTTPIPGSASDVGWSPDGKYLAALGTVVHVWGVESDQFLELAEGAGHMLLLAWSPDSKAVACVRGSGQKHAIWSIPSGKLVCTLAEKLPAAFPQAVCWSPDGKTLVTGCTGTHGYRFWDPVSGKLLRTLKDGDYPAMGRAAYSPDGKLIALSFGYYSCINLYDASSGDRLRITGPWGQNANKGLSWAPDGKSLTASFDYGRLLTFDSATGKARHDVWPFPQIERAEVSPDGKRLAVWGRDLGLNDVRLNLWDLEAGQRVGEGSLGGDRIVWISFSPDGQTLATAGGAGVKLYTAEAGQLLRSCDDKPSYTHAVAWSPDGERLIAGCEDKTARVYSAGSGKLLRTLEGHAAPVLQAAWTSDGKTLASGDSDGKVRLWDADSGQCRHTLELGGQALLMASSPAGNKLAVGSWEHTRIWDEVSGNLLTSVSGTLLGWSVDGKSVHTLGKGVQQTWEADTGKMLRSAKTDMYAPVHVRGPGASRWSRPPALLPHLARRRGASLAAGRRPGDNLPLALRRRLVDHQPGRPLPRLARRREGTGLRRANRQGPGDAHAGGVRPPLQMEERSRAGAVRDEVRSGLSTPPDRRPARDLRRQPLGALTFLFGLSLRGLALLAFLLDLGLGSLALLAFLFGALPFLLGPLLGRSPLLSFLVGALSFLVGALSFLVGALSFLVGAGVGRQPLAAFLPSAVLGVVPFLLEFQVTAETLAVRKINKQIPRFQFQADAEARTGPSFDRQDFEQLIAVAQPAAQPAAIRIVLIVFLHAVTPIELELGVEFSPAIAGRENLPDHLRSNVRLAPLHVRAAIALGPAKYDQRVRRHADGVAALDGIPQQIAGDEDLRVVAEERVQSALDGHDPAKLQGVFRHGLTIAVGVVDVVGRHDRGRGAHTISSSPVDGSTAPTSNSIPHGRRRLKGGPSSMFRGPRPYAIRASAAAGREKRPNREEETMATAPSTVSWKNGYPTSDGKPMAETDWHRDLMNALIQTLKVWYAAQSRVYVSGNLLLFHKPGNRRRHVSPDVFVVKGVAKHDRPNYLLWEEAQGSRRGDRIDLVLDAPRGHGR